MRCGASEPIRLWKLNCAREGTNLGGGWSRARDPRFPVQLHISAPSLADSESAQGALAPTILSDLALQPARGPAAAPGSRNPSPVAECEASELGAPGGGLRTPHAEGVRPAKWAASTPGVQSGAGWARSGRLGLGQKCRGPAPSPEPSACPRLGRWAHSPSLRHSAVSTRASTAKTLASMALAGGGRTEAGHRGDEAAESESAAARGARPAL